MYVSVICFLLHLICLNCYLTEVYKYEHFLMFIYCIELIN